MNQASKPHLHQNTSGKKGVGEGMVAYVHNPSTLGAEAEGSEWRSACIHSKTLSQGEKKSSQVVKAKSQDKRVWSLHSFTCTVL